MNDILSKVTPLTRGIIWLPQDQLKSTGTTYKALDYLLNGLLTAGLEANPEATSRVMLSSNFHAPLHVFVMEKFVAKEYESFLKLLRKDITSEHMVLVIDECESFSNLLSKTPPELKSQLHLFK